MAVTPFETLLTLAPTQPEELTLSGWYGGKPVTVRVKRPNFYHLLARGAVPNPLIPVVQKLFVHGFDAHDVAAADGEFARALLTVAEETLAEPTMDQLREAGIELTDDQLLEIMIYATSGARALAAFRRALRAGNSKPVADVQSPAVGAAEDPGSNDGMGAGSGDRADADDASGRVSPEAGGNR